MTERYKNNRGPNREISRIPPLPAIPPLHPRLDLDHGFLFIQRILADPGRPPPGRPRGAALYPSAPLLMVVLARQLQLFRLRRRCRLFLSGDRSEFGGLPPGPRCSTGVVVGVVRAAGRFARARHVIGPQRTWNRGGLGCDVRLCGAHLARLGKQHCCRIRSSITS